MAALDPSPEEGRLFEVGGQPREDGLERAGCFANAHHVCEELPEHARMLAKGVGQGQPSRHIGCDPRGDPTKRNAVTLFG